MIAIGRGFVQSFLMENPSQFFGITRKADPFSRFPFSRFLDEAWR
jgi:hypothetical protein